MITKFDSFYSGLDTPQKGPVSGTSGDVVTQFFSSLPVRTQTQQQGSQPITQQPQKTGILQTATKFISDVGTKIQEKIAPIKLPSGNTINFTLPTEQKKQAEVKKTSLVPDFGQKKTAGESATLTPEGQYRFSEEYTRAKPKLDWTDKIIDVWRDPTQLAPFVSSAADIGELGQTLIAANKLKSGNASKDDIERLNKFIEKENKNNAHASTHLLEHHKSDHNGHKGPDEF